MVRVLLKKIAFPAVELVKKFVKVKQMEKKKKIIKKLL